MLILVRVKKTENPKLLRLQTHASLGAIKSKLESVSIKINIHSAGFRLSSLNAKMCPDIRGQNAFVSYKAVFRYKIQQSYNFTVPIEIPMTDLMALLS